jgi:hypothetical protein
MAGSTVQRENKREIVLLSNVGHSGEQSAETGKNGVQKAWGKLGTATYFSPS